MKTYPSSAFGSWVVAFRQRWLYERMDSRGVTRCFLFLSLAWALSWWAGWPYSLQSDISFSICEILQSLWPWLIALITMLWSLQSALSDPLWSDQAWWRIQPASASAMIWAKTLRWLWIAVGLPFLGLMGGYLASGLSWPLANNLALPWALAQTTLVLFSLLVGWLAVKWRWVLPMAGLCLLSLFLWIILIGSSWDLRHWLADKMAWEGRSNLPVALFSLAAGLFLLSLLAEHVGRRVLRSLLVFGALSCSYFLAPSFMRSPLDRFYIFDSVRANEELVSISDQWSATLPGIKTDKTHRFSFITATHRLRLTFDTGELSGRWQAWAAEGKPNLSIAAPHQPELSFHRAGSSDLFSLDDENTASGALTINFPRNQMPEKITELHIRLETRKAPH